MRILVQMLFIFMIHIVLLELVTAKQPSAPIVTKATTPATTPTIDPPVSDPPITEPPVPEPTVPEPPVPEPQGGVSSGTQIDTSPTMGTETISDPHDIYPVVSELKFVADESSVKFDASLRNNHYVLLDEEGQFAMMDCVKEDVHAEQCQCDWIIHVENGSMLNADIYIDIPLQPEEYDCGLCHIEYGYFNSRKERVQAARSCESNKIVEYSVKYSMWLKFVCVGPEAHHKLDWVLDGRLLQGFNLTFEVTELPKPEPQKGWDLSTVFAMIVMILSIIAVCSIGFIIYRNCRSQSLQKNILQSRNPLRDNSDRIKRLLRHNRSQHRHGPHEQFVKQHEAHRKLQRVTINNNVAQSHCYPNYSGESLTEYEELSGDNQQPTTSQRALPQGDTSQRPAIKPRRYHIRPTKSNHTYVSILHQRNSDSNSDRDRVDEADRCRNSRRPVKSVSEHFLYADRVRSPVTSVSGDETPKSEPVRVAKTRPIQQCVMFKSKSHHSGVNPPKRRKKKPAPHSKLAGVASEYGSAVRAGRMRSEPSGLSLPCGIIDEIRGDSSGSYNSRPRSAEGGHRSGVYSKRGNKTSASATSLNSEMSVVLRVVDPLDDDQSLMSGVVLTSAPNEREIDERTKRKLLTAPRYTSPQTANAIPQIILTRASTKRKSHTSPHISGCSPVAEVESSNSGISSDCSSHNKERSRSTASLPDDFSRTEARLMQHANYASDESAVSIKGRHCASKITREGHLKPRSLSKQFTPEAVLLYKDETRNGETTINNNQAPPDIGSQSRTADAHHENC